MTYALEGIRVIDLTQYQLGPHATMMLADMGAEVIKIERPGDGDPGRLLGPWGPAGTSAFFEANDRNKKSITVDIKTEKGKEIIYKLVRQADIFAQNFRPGTAERLGFGYKDLYRINPGIIYLTGSAFGLKGPMSKKPGFDGVGQAMSGILSTVWTPEDVPATSMEASISDQTASFLLALGAMVALVHKERTGEGQEVDVSLLGSTMELAGWTLQSHLTPEGSASNFQVPRARIGRFGASEAVIVSSHKARDGKPILLFLRGRAAQVKCFSILGLEDFADDSRFETWEPIVENLDILLTAMDQRILSRDRDDWLKLLDDGGVIAAPLHTLLEAAAHPQAIANEYIAEINHPKEGSMKILGIPIKLHKTPGRLGIAPELGEHTDEILSEIAGYTTEEIAQMKREEII